MAEVVLTDVCKVFPSANLTAQLPGRDSLPALSNLTFRLSDGEAVVLVGPTGSGKTTALRVIAGLEQPTAGRIAIGGRDVTHKPARERDVAMVFQRQTLFPHLDVRRNILFGLKIRRKTGWFSWGSKAADDGDELALKEVLGLLKLDGLLDRKPHQLSGGEQQRVAMGRALVRRPAVFLLDEPLAHLDARLRSEMRRDLHLLQRQLRATMIWVTHDPVEAMTLADRVLVLDRGVVQQVDSPEVLYNEPVNRMVAGFFGWPAMNFVDGTLEGDEGCLRFRSDGLSWTVPEQYTGSWLTHRGQPLTLGIRPEQVRLGEHDTLALKAQVKLVEFLGGDALLTLERDGLQFTARMPEMTRVREGDNVSVIMNMNEAHLFDRATGHRIGGRNADR